MSARLVEYWRLTLPLPIAARRRTLDRVIAKVRGASVERKVLIPFVLGDPDEEIVFRAAVAYVRRSSAGGVSLAAAIEATEWVRRGLSLNRGAVFAALVSWGGESVLERLLPLRLTLERSEVETVLRRVEKAPTASMLEFLQTWFELAGEDWPESALSSELQRWQASRRTARQARRATTSFQEACGP